MLINFVRISFLGSSPDLSGTKIGEYLMPLDLTNLALTNGSSPRYLCLQSINPDPKLPLNSLITGIIASFELSHFLMVSMDSTTLVSAQDC